MSGKRKIMFAVCLVVFVAAVAFIIVYTAGIRQKSEVYDELAETARVEETEEEEETEPEEEEEEETEPEEEESVLEIPIDFEALWEENPDIYAWITIEDTVIDYPVLQSEEDDDKYLEMTVDYQSGLPGSIYTQYSYNTEAFTGDSVTVIYGHNMKNDTMFGSLSEYQNEEYREEHSEIIIYMPDCIYTYEIVFAVTYDNRHILYNFDCNNEYEYEDFLNSIETERLLPSWISDPFEVTTDDRLIVLSTCNGNSSQRFLVGAKLVNEEY